MQRSRAVVVFMLVALAMALPALVAIRAYEKLELHALINTHHTQPFDLFFSWATHLADGLVPTLLAVLLLLFKDVRSCLMMGLGCGFSAILVQTMKRMVYPDMHRPGMFRDALGDMRWVADIELHHFHSFPSGHATAAFSMCLALAVIIGRPQWGALLGLLACLLAFSRVYLSQHFTQDILAGAALGTVTTALVYVWLYRSTFAQRAWLDRQVGQPPK